MEEIMKKILAIAFFVLVFLVSVGAAVLGVGLVVTNSKLDQTQIELVASRQKAAQIFNLQKQLAERKYRQGQWNSDNVSEMEEINRLEQNCQGQPTLECTRLHTRSLNCESSEHNLAVYGEKIEDLEWRIEVMIKEFEKP